MWVDYKPVDEEIDDDNSRIFIQFLFEMRIGMNEFDHHILALQKHCIGIAEVRVRIPAQA